MYISPKDLFLLTLAVFLAACFSCGGGSGGSGSAPTPAQSHITVVGPTTRAGVGGMLLGGNPLWVFVVDASNQPVSNSTVTFSGPAGIDLFPSSSVTNSTGFARAWVRLPNIAGGKFTVQATASTGGTATFSISTGPRLVSSFGDASTTCGAVAADGTYYTGSSFSSGSNSPGSPAIFNPDGTLKTVFRSLPAGKPPLEENNVLLITPDQRIYFSEDAIFVTDASLNLVRILDFTGRIANMDRIGGKYAADSPGFSYMVFGGGAAVYDTAITRQQDIGFGFGNEDNPGAVGNAAGHLVTMGGPSSAGSGFQLLEVDHSSKVIHSQPLPPVLGPQATVKINSAGSYFVFDGASLISVFDSSLNPLQTISLPYRAEQFAGADAAGNLYFCGDAGTTVTSSTGALRFSLGNGGVSSQLNTYPNKYMGAFLDPSDVAADPVTSTFYYSDHSQILKFSAGGFQTSVPGSGTDFLMAHGMVFVPPGQLYANLSTFVEVRDASTGVLIKTINDSHFSFLASIAADLVQNKYLLDSMKAQIHVLSPSDQYIRAIPLNLPPAFASFNTAGRLVVNSDGSLLLCVSSKSTPDAGYLKKIRISDGTELWSKTFSDPLSFDPVLELAQDATGRIYALRNQELEIYDSSGALLNSIPTPANGSSRTGPAPMIGVGNTVYLYLNGSVYGLTMD